MAKPAGIARLFKRDTKYYGVEWRPWAAVAAFIGGVVAMFVTVAFVANLLMAKSCHEKGDLFQVEDNYSFWTGCKVRVEDRWIDIDAIENESDGIRIFIPSEEQ
jgi:hypothetical protein